MKHISRALAICMLVFFLLLSEAAPVYSFPYNGLELKVKGVITEIYDDNLTFAAEDKKDDFITGLTLNLGIAYKSRRRDLALNGLISHNINAKHSDLENSSENLNLNFRNEFTKYDMMELSNSFSHSDIPSSFEEEFGRVTERRETFVNNFNLNYDKNISKYFTVTTSYSNTINMFPNEEFQDSMNNVFQISLQYLQNAASTYSLGYSYSVARFDDSGNSSTHSIVTGLQKFITKAFYINGEVGVDFLTSVYDSKSTKSFVDFSLTNDIDSNTQAVISFLRRDQVSSDSENFFSNWRISGTFTRQLLEKINGSVHVFYGSGEFTSSNIENTLLGTDIKFSYDFEENFTGFVSYSYSHSDITGEASGYKKNRILLSLAKSF